MTATVDAVPGTLPAAVLWDMDGTLVDTEPYWFAAERDLVEEFGNEWPDHHAHAMVGFDLLDAAAYMQEHGGVELSRHEIVDRLLDGVIARLHRRIPWRPGARELLAELNAEGVPCALVTMSWRRFVDPVLAALPEGSFVAAITGDEVPEGMGKPHPEPYRLGAEACGTDPFDCIAIEDSPTGLRSARRAGCHVIGVPNVKELSPGRGIAVVDTLEGVGAHDLRALVDEQLAADESAQRGAPFTLGREARRRVLLAVAVVAALILGVALFGGDDGEAEPALPPGAVPIDVWAPYWTLGDTTRETDVRFGEIRELSPFWYGARGATDIVVDENASEELASAFLDEAQTSAARVVPSIVDEMPAGGMAAILADPATRSQHVDAIMAFADDVDADGIDLDYEQFAFADGRASWPATRPNWVTFVAELAARLHDDGRTLTVSIPGVWNVDADSSDGYWVYDHGAIAEHVDAIRIMAYDYSVQEPGPIAPIDWVESVVAGTSLAVPEEHHDKLVLGVPAYGSNWVESTLGSCPSSAEGRTNATARTVLDLASRRGGTPVYDETTAEWSFVYALTVEDGATSCVQNRRVHWVDAEGAAARVEIARRAGWGGVALWALGYEDDDVWSAVVDASRRSLAAEG
ncbi:MAG: HAD-IA family hydrolase [Ilumatobacter sp.]|uniref:HAD-IA family hydrolase n=1 Tax=Ilumatobacter sp. TaxID=1967498 RepID=UPI00262DB787|nr:HAD-IA family hydrolase [Ilumatobacter sp.]MDJ0771142.1 HAD-IA family hydrolase [Ilumatobacter sp.]